MQPDELPNLRRVGRYAFYAPCAFGFAILAAALLISAFGMKKEWVRQAIGPVFVVAFLALRDLEKNAEARGRAQSLTPTSSEQDT